VALAPVLLHNEKAAPWTTIQEAALFISAALLADPITHDGRGQPGKGDMRDVRDVARLTLLSARVSFRGLRQSLEKAASGGE
jgi:hypothetical protein